MTGRLVETPLAKRQLLAAIAVQPPGAKLSIPRLRDALVCQADVLDALKALVDAGELDRSTLRPPVTLVEELAAVTPPPSRVPGAQLAAELNAYIDRHGLARTRVSKHLLGGTNAIARLARPGQSPRQATIDKIRAFIALPPPSGLEVRPAGGARVPDVGGVTGAELAAKLDALIAEHGLSSSAVGLHLVGQRSGVATIRHSNPRRKTVERVLAFLADPPLDQLKPRDSWEMRRAKQQDPARPSAAAVLAAARRVPLSPPVLEPPVRVDPQRATPLPTFLKPAETAWCAQCEQRVGGAKAAQCLSTWCSLKEKAA